MYVYINNIYICCLDPYWYIYYFNPYSVFLQIHQVDIRTDQEKADDLIKEYMAEIKLPSSSELYKEIHTTLNSQYDEFVNRYSAMEIEVYIFAWLTTIITTIILKNYVYTFLNLVNFVFI